jgi:hypothetical protein
LLSAILPRGIVFLEAFFAATSTGLFAAIF